MAGTSVQSTTGSRGVRISGSNAAYTMFRGSVKGTGYPLHSPVSPSLPLVRQRVPSRFNWTLTIFVKTSTDITLIFFFFSVCTKNFRLLIFREADVFVTYKSN